MATNQTNEDRQTNWPLREGETVEFLGQEYMVIKPGAPGLNAELQLLRNHDISVFVDATEFDLSVEPLTPK